jgi:hypothetical protein
MTTGTVLYDHLFIHIQFLDDSDEPTGLISHLPRRILREHAEKRKRRRAVTNEATLEADSDNEDDEDDVQQPVESGRWLKKDPELLGSRVPAFVPKPLPDADRKVLDDLSTAYDYYKLFQPDSFAQEVNFVKANQNIFDQMKLLLKKYLMLIQYIQYFVPCKETYIFSLWFSIIQNFVLCKETFIFSLW